MESQISNNPNLSRYCCICKNSYFVEDDKNKSDQNTEIFYKLFDLSTLGINIDTDIPPFEQWSICDKINQENNNCQKIVTDFLILLQEFCGLKTKLKQSLDKKMMHKFEESKSEIII
jgi:hypothetical protein